MDQEPIKRDVLDYDDIRRMVPALDGHPKVVNVLMRFLAIDKVNWIHGRNADTPGVPFTEGLLDDLNVTRVVRGQEHLEQLPDGAFITVSNHPFGAMDGIMLINLIGKLRPDFKVMVNMILNYISAMRSNFIAVDALASNDPAKRAVSMHGITEALKHVKAGHPLGFFPAGAVSKFTSHLRIEDRQWQPNVMRLIAKLKVPVLPIYFHGHNSLWFNILGVIDWRLRTLRLPAEVFRSKNRTFRISVGEPIAPETYARYDTPEALGDFLKRQTYAMKQWQH